VLLDKRPALLDKPQRREAVPEEEVTERQRLKQWTSLLARKETKRNGCDLLGTHE